MEPRRLQRAIHLSIADGAMATVMGALTGGVFLTGFALALGATRLQIGMLAAIPEVAKLAQLAGSWRIERTGRRKSLCLWATTAGRVLWIPLAMCALLPAGGFGASRVWIMLSLLLAGHALLAIGGVAWLSWTRDVVPTPMQVGFFARRHQLNTPLAIVLSIASGVFLDWYCAGHTDSVGGFMAIFLLAVALGFVSLGLLAGIPEPVVYAPTAKMSLRALVAPLLDKKFRGLVGFFSAWCLASNLSAPFFALFMLQKLQLPFWAVTSLAMFSSALGLAANGFWTRLSLRFGVRPVVVLAMVGEAMVPAAWLLVTPETLWIVVLVHCAGVFAAPISMAPNNLVLKLAPTSGASPYPAIFGAVVGPVTALSAVLGGAALMQFADIEWSVGAHTFGALKTMFFVSFVGRLASLALLAKLPEPGAVTSREVAAHLAASVALQLRAFAALFGMERMVETPALEFAGDDLAINVLSIGLASGDDATNDALLGDIDDAAPAAFATDETAPAPARREQRMAA